LAEKEFTIVGRRASIRSRMKAAFLYGTIHKERLGHIRLGGVYVDELARGQNGCGK